MVGSCARDIRTGRTRVLRCWPREIAAAKTAAGKAGMSVSSGTTSTQNEKGNGSGELAAALTRLNKSLAALESAVDARLDREVVLGDAEAEVQRIGADRARLAESLDNSEARAKRLENTNREVSRRLVDAMEAIRSVLDRRANAEHG